MVYLEYLTIGGLVIFQLFIAYRLLGKIELYGLIFRSLPSVEQIVVPYEVYYNGNIVDILSYEVSEDTDDHIELTVLTSNSPNIVFDNIILQINSYLIKNKSGTIDYHVVKDTVDRNVEIIEDDINNRIPAPLYMGLAATMLGIIFGLVSVDFGDSNTALNAIQPLIDGVKVAMSASVLGLIITTIFSVKVFKDASYSLEFDKNNFLSKLQSDLLPKMNKSKIPEVETLSNKLDTFARNTSGSITQLDSIVKTSSKSVQIEQELIKEISKLDIEKVTKSNVHVFNQLDGMMNSFDNFADYYNRLNTSLSSTNELVSSLNGFVSTTKDIHIVFEDIKKTVADSNSASKFFNEHITSFSRYGDAVKEAVTNADSSMSKAVGEISNLASKEFEKLNEGITDYDKRLSDAFNSSIESFSNTADTHAKRVEEAFDNSRPRFEKLNKLDHLDVIDTRLVDLDKNLSGSFRTNSESIISELKELNELLNKSSEKNKPSKWNVIFENTSKAFKVGAYFVIIIYGLHTYIQYLSN